MMHTLTPQEQLKNCEAYLRNWDTVPRDLIYPRLRDWSMQEEHTCRTLHCAGGWLPYFPEFRGMGVYRDDGGRPALFSTTSGGSTMYGRSVSLYLFGEYNLFASRGYPSQEDPHLTDHACVIGRFQRQILTLKKTLGEYS